MTPKTANMQSGFSSKTLKGFGMSVLLNRILHTSPLLAAGVFVLLALCGTAQAATVTFTASGNWTAPAGVSSVDVEAWGGGGAGGGNPTTTDGGGGGGGGAYAKTTAIPVTPGNVYPVIVGAGGIGGTGTGGNGGDSWFATATTIMAKGGTGGAAPAGGAGGVAGSGGAAASSIGMTTFSGGNGGTGRNSNTGRGGPGGSSAGTTANGTSGSATWTTATAAAPRLAAVSAEMEVTPTARMALLPPPETAAAVAVARKETLSAATARSGRS